MTQTATTMGLWLRRLLGAAPDAPKMPLQQYLDELLPDEARSADDGDAIVLHFSP